MVLLSREANIGAAHSADLRSRVVAEVAAGSSRRKAARFKVSPLEAQTDSVSPRPRGGKTSPLEAHAVWLKALLRKAAERTVGRLWDRIGDILKAFTPQECAN